MVVRGYFIFKKGLKKVEGDIVSAPSSAGPSSLTNTELLYMLGTQH